MLQPHLQPVSGGGGPWGICAAWGRPHIRAVPPGGHMWGRTRLLGPAESVLMSVASPAGGSRCTRSGNSLTGSPWHTTGCICLKGTVGSAGRGGAACGDTVLGGGCGMRRSPPVRDRMHFSRSFLPSEAAPYLPVEEKSPLFCVQREGLEDGGALYRLNRSVGDRGVLPRAAPVAWCPDPLLATDSAPCSPTRSAGTRPSLWVAPSGPWSGARRQRVQRPRSTWLCTATEPWRRRTAWWGCTGAPRCCSSGAWARCRRGEWRRRGDSTGLFVSQSWGCRSPAPTFYRGSAHSSADRAGLAYAIAADHGCVWDMKFCPSGAWEPPGGSSKVGMQAGCGFSPLVAAPKRCLPWTERGDPEAPFKNQGEAESLCLSYSTRG